jgi:hypothetical protein
MRGSIKETFTRGGFQVERVSWADRSRWGSAFDKAEKIGLSALYEFAFRTASASVHGMWTDLSLHHLAAGGSFPAPDLEYHPANPKPVELSTDLCLKAAYEYVELILGAEAAPFTERLAEISDWWYAAERRHWDASGEFTRA